MVVRFLSTRLAVRVATAMTSSYEGGDSFAFNREIPFELPVRASKATLPTDKLELARAALVFADLSR